MVNGRPVLTVSDVNQYIKKLISNDGRLQYIYVKGKFQI